MKSEVKLRRADRSAGCVAPSGQRSLDYDDGDPFKSFVDLLQTSLSFQWFA